MVFKKIIFYLALSSIVASGLLQTTKANNQINNSYLADNARFHQSNRLEPFNSDAFDHSFSDGNGDYYAYYDKKAFISPSVAGGTKNGYVLDLSYQQLIYIGYVYNWVMSLPIAVRYPYGYMISYLTNYEDFQSPYSGYWPLSYEFDRDAHFAEVASISWSIALNPIDANGFIQNAIIYHQTVSFYFYSNIVYTRLLNLYYAKIMIVNNQTFDSIETQWYPSYPH